jgi:hypothetical protein
MQRLNTALFALAFFVTVSGLPAEDLPQATPAAAPAATTSEQSAQPSESAPLAYGLPLLGDKTEEGRRFLVLADPSGSEILLSADSEPDEARMSALTTLTKSLRESKSLAISEIRAVNYADRLQIVVLLQALAIDGKDQASSLPSGLQFYYENGYEYDFRVKANDRFVRVKGLYTSFADLTWLIGQAIADPAAYIAETEPLALAHRMDELSRRANILEAALMASMNGGKAIRIEAIQRLKELREAEPKLAKAPALSKLKAEGLALTPKEIDIAYLVLFGEH